MVEPYDVVNDDGLVEGVLPITANLSAVVHRTPESKFAHEGLEVDLGVISRKKVSAVFVADLAKSMVPANTTEYGYHKNYRFWEWGQSATEEASSQTKCIAPAATFGTNGDASLDIGTQVAGATSYSSVATLEAIATVAITETDIHPTGAYAPADSFGIDRCKFTSIGLDDNDSVTFTYTLNIPAEA